MQWYSIICNQPLESFGQIKTSTGLEWTYGDAFQHGGDQVTPTFSIPTVQAEL